MKSPLFLALDIGTSSVRAALYDCRGNVLPETIVKNDRVVRITEGGGAELDAAEAFGQIIAAIDDVLQKCPADAKEIQFSATSCFWHSLVGIDAAGEPTTPVYTWAETRPAAHVKTLRRELNEEEIHNRTGCRFHSSYWTAKLLWLRLEQKEIFENTAKWLSFSDYLTLNFFAPASNVPPASRRPSRQRLADDPSAGRTRDSRRDAGGTSVSMASGTGIFDIRRNDWDDQLIDYLKITRDNLPEIVESDDRTFKLNEYYSERWAKLKTAEWFLPIGDGAANNIGANCLEKGKAALMIGTSGAMRVAFAGEVPEKIPNGLWCYRIDRRRIIIGGALSDGGGLYYWLKENFRLKQNDDKTERKIQERPADGHGLTFLPFLAGERSTGFHVNASGAIIGLKSANDKIDIVQAALESVAYRFAEIHDQLNEVLEITEIVASGGALRESPVWTQIICDTLGSDLNLPDTREASSRGAVLFASEAAGQIEKIAELETLGGRRFTCDRGRYKIYQAARSRHQKFYKLLIE